MKYLVNQVLANAPGDVTVLYGGKVNGVGFGNIVNEMATHDPCLGVIKNTPVTKFILDTDFNEIVVKALL